MQKKFQNSIHFSVNDMQVSEDLQLIVGHVCMKYFAEKKIRNEIFVGRTGFIGSHIVEALIKNNDVIVLDNFSTGRKII